MCIIIEQRYVIKYIIKVNLVKEQIKVLFLVIDLFHCSLRPQALQKAGVISGGDMTPEAALCKLSYVLGKDGWTPDTRKKVKE